MCQSHIVLQLQISCVSLTQWMVDSKMFCFILFSFILCLWKTEMEHVKTKSMLAKWVYRIRGLKCEITSCTVSVTIFCLVVHIFQPPKSALGLNWSSPFPDSLVPYLVPICLKITKEHLMRN